ncbi:MAG: carboxypeptidase regulatory-like domain-containing protein [Nitrospirota bacterium]
MTLAAGVAACALLAANPAQAGTIQGKVSVQGKTSADHVVVYVERAPGTFTPSGPRPELIHRNLAFFPPVMPVLKGSIVDFPNTDPVFHSAFSVSPSNPFELGIYGQGRDKFVQFHNPGVVEISCHIHPFMRATILVLDNPFFAVTNEQGHYTIMNVPPGQYTVRTWSVNGQPMTRSVVVDRSGAAALDITIAP